MLVDLHTHTHFSHDCNADIDALCQSAIASGVSVLALTDHFDVWEIPTHKGSTYDAATAYGEVCKAKKRYADKLQVLYGIELGEPVEFADEARALLAEYPFEFVIGSLHQIPNAHDFYFSWGESNPTSEQMFADFSDYLDALAEVAEFPNIHTLAHITYPLRYAAKVGKIFAIDRFLPAFDRVFRTLIRRGVALEINTSGLRQTIGKTMPDENLLRRYYDMGGRRITIGSDAHRPDDIGAGIAETISVLRDIGFRDVMTVRAGAPAFLPLV